MIAKLSVLFFGRSSSNTLRVFNRSVFRKYSQTNNKFLSISKNRHFIIFSVNFCLSSLFQVITVQILQINFSTFSRRCQRSLEYLSRSLHDFLCLSNASIFTVVN